VGRQKQREAECVKAPGGGERGVGHAMVKWWFGVGSACQPPWGGRPTTTCCQGTTLPSSQSGRANAAFVTPMRHQRVGHRLAIVGRHGAVRPSRIRHSNAARRRMTPRPSTPEVLHKGWYVQKAIASRTNC